MKKLNINKPSANVVLTVASVALTIAGMIVGNAKEANEMQKLSEKVKDDVLKELSNK